MKHQKIKFDHPYCKIYGQQTAKLIHIERVSCKDLDEFMINMDTQYYVEVPSDTTPEIPKKELRSCKLKKGSLILLIFLGDKNIPFTTLRNFRDSTFRAYRSLIGDMFDIVVKNEG